jgi:PRTRC genetic system protein E
VIGKVVEFVLYFQFLSTKQSNIIGGCMFTELMPLLTARTVLITVARESDSTIRATVVPKRASETENAALSTPLSFVGTPEELDRDFARELGAYVDAHQRLGSSLAEAIAAMEAAAKAAQDEARRKAEERRKSKTPTSTSPLTPSNSPSASTVPSSPAQPKTTELFGSPATDQPQQGGLRL